MTDQYAEIRQLAAQVARGSTNPWRSRSTSTAPLPKDERRRLGDLGFLGIAHPEKYGGSGAPLEEALVVIEEIAKVCRPAAFQVFEANTGPAQVITHLASEEQRERWLPDIISGEKTMAVGISEPTRARPPPTCAPPPRRSAASS
ncbi:acyl-CoA dehydrogenase family protein [Nocardioides daphniae]|uniref:acyl-CoA dehydrogenase family protein n=1 Tax=Nocardioides daphniae TaxID=402297 RepID=UPI001930EEEC|nr:acyl-CoA dehydrogenase family protein [Nocardioides daphniae]